MTNGPDPAEVDRLDRVLGRKERLFGLAAAFVFCLVTSALSVLLILGFVLSLYSADDTVYTPIAVLLALLLPVVWWSGRLFHRELRGRPRKPNPMAQLALGLFVLASGIPLVWSGLQTDGPSDPRTHDLYFAAALVLYGATWAVRAWRRLRDEDFVDAFDPLDDEK